MPKKAESKSVTATKSASEKQVRELFAAKARLENRLKKLEERRAPEPRSHSAPARSPMPAQTHRISAGGAALATLAVVGTLGGVYALGLNKGWWTLPSWLGGPTQAAAAAQRAAAAREAALRAARQASERRYPGQGDRRQGYTGFPVGDETQSNAGAAAGAAYLPDVPIYARQAGVRYERRMLPDGQVVVVPVEAPPPGGPSGITQAANQRTLRRLFTSS